MIEHEERPAQEVHEREWLVAVSQGDRRAFEHLYQRYHDRLARFLLRYTPRRDLIDEIVNQALWVVWRKSGEFRGDSKVGTWIIGIAYRCMLKALRDSGSRQEPFEAPFDESTTGVADDTDDGEHRELRDWVRHGLLLLPVEQRTTMELAYFMGQSCEEIASIMNCAVGTVKARMFHARLRLRNTLPALGGEISHARTGLA
ncbi:MAG: sigma-70 family RNA polymerase sigma factor [Dokdonella sp.]